MEVPKCHDICMAFAVCLLSLWLWNFVVMLRNRFHVIKGLDKIPGPNGLPFFGILPSLLKNYDRFYDFIEELHLEYGDTFKTPPDPMTDGVIYITKAEDVKHILMTRFDNYIKPPMMIRAWGEFLGNSFITLNQSHTQDKGALWKRQRKVAVKAFSTNKFRDYNKNVFQRTAESEIKSIQDQLKDNQNNALDIQKICQVYTLKSIFEVGFGESISQIAKSAYFADCLDTLTRLIAERYYVKRYFKWFGWIMPSEYTHSRCVNHVQSVADMLVNDRLNEDPSVLEKRSDILSLFVKELQQDVLTKHSGYDAFNARMLTKIVLTFVLAGRDTTASCLTWLFYSLCKNQHLQDKLFSEISEFSSNNENIDYDGIMSLKYLDAAVYETLRLYPPVPFDVRISAEDDSFPDGTFVPANTEIYFCPWLMGRNAAKWESPKIFRPERWLEREKKPSAFEFPVFQAGPRICIGMKFAIAEVKLFTVLLLKEYKLSLDSEGDRTYQTAPILAMKDGLPLRFTKRS